MKKEIWKNIPKYKNYLISNYGIVRNIKTNKELKGSLTKSGYVQVAMHDKGHLKTEKLHRLVAMAFLPNPKGYDQINHIDEVKINNELSNLEWCNSQYNNEYTLSKIYSLISPSGVFVDVFNLNKFCRKEGLDPCHMYKVSNGSRKSHKGWKSGL